MGRRRGGYLGGSTIITPSRKQASADEGPPSALERARIENNRLKLDEAHRQRALKATDAKLTAVEDAIYEAALILHHNFADPIQPRLDTIMAFAADEAETISSLGPSQRRRSRLIQEDYRLLLEALAADEADRLGVLWKTTAYKTRVHPLYEGALRKARRPSR